MRLKHWNNYALEFLDVRGWKKMRHIFVNDHYPVKGVVGLYSMLPLFPQSYCCLVVVPTWIPTNDNGGINDTIVQKR